MSTKFKPSDFGREVLFKGGSQSGRLAGQTSDLRFAFIEVVRVERGRRVKARVKVPTYSVRFKSPAAATAADNGGDQWSLS